MTDDIKDINQKLENKKPTIKQLELQLKRLEQQQAKEKEKLTKQLEREREKEQKNQARKLRNKKIYDWGGLVPLAFGPEEFDKIADNPELKQCMIGLLLTVRSQLKTVGFGLTAENKPTWLEYYKNQSKKFLEERNNG
ncbi:MAG: hypothetical protein EKK54_12140 [Neisseriaceae bacterium]|nr:MAG: hypothetical protein EKK54_12140 [Neisseriaceae bacterium]